MNMILRLLWNGIALMNHTKEKYEYFMKKCENENLWIMRMATLFL